MVFFVLLILPLPYLCMYEMYEEDWTGYFFLGDHFTLTDGKLFSLNQSSIHSIVLHGLLSHECSRGHPWRRWTSASIFLES